VWYDAVVIPEVIGAAMAVLVAALPPPPETVVRETKTYGTITIPHAKHLALRVACRDCHGRGRVRKITFTPRAAHGACRSCHVERQAGPVECRGCHVIAPRTTELAAVTTGPEVQPAAARRPSILDPLLTPVNPEERVWWTRFPRTAEFGVTMLTGVRQDVVFGPSIQLTARNGPTALSYGVSYEGGPEGGVRTQLLVGGGGWFIARPRVRVTGVALCGLDAALDPVTLMPAVGARAGIEFLHDSAWTFGLSATGVVDLANTKFGDEQVGGATISIGLSTGYRLRP
jgi:hypothetical protein